MKRQRRRRRPLACRSRRPRAPLLPSPAGLPFQLLDQLPHAPMRPHQPSIAGDRNNRPRCGCHSCGCWRWRASAAWPAPPCLQRPSARKAGHRWEGGTLWSQQQTSPWTSWRQCSNSGCHRRRTTTSGAAQRPMRRSIWSRHARKVRGALCVAMRRRAAVGATACLPARLAQHPLDTLQ